MIFSLSRPVHKRKQIRSLKPLKTLQLAKSGNNETFHSPDLLTWLKKGITDILQH